MPVEGGDILWRIKGESSSFTAETNKARDAMGRFVKSAGDADKSVAGLGKGMATSFKGILPTITMVTQSVVNFGRIAMTAFRGLDRLFVEPLKDSVSSAMEFRGALASLATLGVKDLDGMGDSIKDVSAAFGLDLQDSVKAAYQAISAGSSVAETPRLLEKAALAAAAGQSNLTAAIELGTGVVNAYGKDISEVADVYDQAFYAVKVGVTTFDELAASVGKLSPSFVSAGLSSNEMFGAIAALTKGGINTAESVTYLGAVVTAFQRQGQTAMLETKGFAGAMEWLKEATGGNQAEMLKFLGSTEAMKAVLALTGAQAESFSEIMDGMSAPIGAAQEAFNAFAKDNPEFAWKQLNSEISILKVELGEALLPIFYSIVQAVKPIVKSIKEWISANSDVITSAIQTSGAARFISDAIGWVRDNWETLTQAVWAGWEIVKIAWESLKALAFSVFLVISGVISGFAASVGEQFGKIITDTEWAKKTWQEKLQLILDTVRDIFQKVRNFLQDKAVPWLQENWNKIVEGAQNFYSSIIDPIIGFGTAIADFFAPAIDIVSKLADAFRFLNGVTGGKVWDYLNYINPVNLLNKPMELIADIFGGGKYRGGAVNKGREYTVGERGGEVVFPENPSKHPLAIGLGGAAKWIAPWRGWVLPHEGALELAAAMPNLPFADMKQNAHVYRGGIMNALAGNKVPGSLVSRIWNSDAYTYVRGIAGQAAAARASGGPIVRGSPYLVGERGPELIIPQTSGNVIPNNQLGGMGSNITITIPIQHAHMNTPQDMETLSRRLVERIYLEAGPALAGLPA